MSWLSDENLIIRDSQEPSLVFPRGAMVQYLLIQRSQWLYRRQLPWIMRTNCIYIDCPCIYQTQLNFNNIKMFHCGESSPGGWENNSSIEIVSLAELGIMGGYHKPLGDNDQWKTAIMKMTTFWIISGRLGQASEVISSAGIKPTCRSHPSNNKKSRLHKN